MTAPITWPAKVVYLAPRPARTGLDQFRREWRAFGSLAMSLPIWRHILRYDQCDPVESPADARSRFAEGHGGVGMIWFKSVSDMEAVGKYPDMQTMRDAEVELFGRVNEGELTVVEHRIFERSVPELEVIAFVHRVPTITREEFSRRYRDFATQFEAFGNPATLCCRYTQNQVTGPEGGPDAVAELGFPGVDELISFFSSSDERNDLLALESTMIDHARTTAALVRRHPVFETHIPPATLTPADSSAGA